MQNHVQLRLYLLETDKYHNTPAYQAVITYLHKHGYAGATVLRGLESFGSQTHRIHLADVLDLSTNPPVVIEIIDTAERIEELKSALRETGMIGSRLVTEQPVKATRLK